MTGLSDFQIVLHLQLLASGLIAALGVAVYLLQSARALGPIEGVEWSRGE